MFLLDFTKRGLVVERGLVVCFLLKVSKSVLLFLFVCIFSILGAIEITNQLLAFFCLVYCLIFRVLFYILSSFILLYPCTLYAWSMSLFLKEKKNKHHSVSWSSASLDDLLHCYITRMTIFFVNFTIMDHKDSSPTPGVT